MLLYSMYKDYVSYLVKSSQSVHGMIVFAHDSNRKNKAVPGCCGIPGFP